MLAIDTRPDALSIRTARVAGGRDRLHCQLGLERALGAAGVSDSALLVIRRLAVRAELEEGGRRFASTLGRSVAGLRASARRPWRDADSDRAEAVLFADEAELIACLARDWLRQRVADVWFWRALFGRESADQLVQQALVARGAAVPSAFGLLALAGLDVAFAARLPAHVAEAVRKAAAAAHGLPIAPAAAGVARVVSADTGLVVAAPDWIAAQKRLLRVVPELAAPLLSPPQRGLLALALALERAPAWTRTDGLRAVLDAASPDIASLWSSVESGAEIAESFTGKRAREADCAAGSQALFGGPPPGSVETAGALDSEQLPERALLSPVRPMSDSVAAGVRAPEPGFEAARDQRDDVRDGGISFQGTVTAPGSVPLQAPAAWGAPGAEADPEERIATDFAGIFHLLNVTLALGLYGDFTQPLHPGIALSPWDFLALAGRRWFGAPFVADPVWPLLARLAARRATDPPGAGFKPPGDWRLPQDWLQAFGAAEILGFHATRRRILLMHPAGFAVAQARRSEDAPPRAAIHAILEEMPALRGARLARLPAPAGLPRGGVARWLALQLDAIAARLQAALGARATETPDFLCRHPGLVRPRRDRLEVELSLAALPVAIRLAGLDRDPGWIPASGRTITFRFT